MILSRFFQLTAGLLFLGLSACGPGPTDGDMAASAARPVADQLDEVSARARKARISDVSYKLDIDLTSDPDAFAGVVEIEFALADGGQPLDIDFAGGLPGQIEVNGVATAASYNGFFITLPGEALATGENRVRIVYSHPYSQDGTGLHRFVDPADGQTYLYTYLWPYYANRLFPSFDQPDLKATYELSVRAPSDWQVVSAARESRIEDQGDTRLWTFPRSEKFSTYIFSLHAGPYAVWEDSSGDIPIRLFARRSLAERVPAEEWLEVTRRGLIFYADYFDIPYPFHKYDQVLVPDFLIGAMENVAAVTFTERYAPRGAPNRFQRERRAGTILHEMAHMWFGDLVTKTWWNDLWLNESFATYMASLAVPQATEFSDTGHNFFLGNKLSAYRADSLVTTHPITVPVPSTDDFFTVFDGISYGKGASVLQQLAHYVGAGNFRSGVSAYLKKHAYGNTRLPDFIAALSAASGRDLVPWSEQWLARAGVNKIAARYRCESGKVSTFTILQSAPEGLPTLRSQVLQVGLYAVSDEGAVDVRAVLPVEISGAETRLEGAIGLACPDMVYPNHGDWGYAQLTLDPKTLKVLKTSLSEIADPLLRSMFWYSLEDMATGGELALEEYLGLVLANAPVEQNERALQQVLRGGARVLRLLDRLTPGADATLAAFAPRIERMVQEMMAAPAASADARKLLFDTYVAVARTDSAQSRLERFLVGDESVTGIEIDQDRRWAIIARLNALGHEGAEDLLAREAAADMSYAGQQMAILADAGRADPAIKSKWLATLLEDGNSLPLSKQRSAIAGLFPSHQTALHAAFLDEILAALPELGRTRDPYLLSSYAGTLLYGVCTMDSVAKLASALQDGEGLHPTLFKFLREAHQRDEACVGLRP